MRKDFDIKQFSKDYQQIEDLVSRWSDVKIGEYYDSFQIDDSGVEIYQDDLLDGKIFIWWKDFFNIELLEEKELEKKEKNNKNSIQCIKNKIAENEIQIEQLKKRLEELSK